VFHSFQIPSGCLELENVKAHFRCDRSNGSAWFELFGTERVIQYIITFIRFFNVSTTNLFHFIKLFELWNK